MGGERASKTRQREAGKICARCGVLLGPPPPGHKPGYRTGERFCTRCEPVYRIVCNVAESLHAWSVHFLDTDGQTPLGPWLLFEDEAAVRRMLARGDPDPADMDRFAEHIAKCNYALVHLRLTRLQRAALIARGRGWPWNGYELLQMHAAGTYPPQRLTEAQERAFLRNRTG